MKNTPWMALLTACLLSVSVYASEKVEKADDNAPAKATTTAKPVVSSLKTRESAPPAKARLASARSRAAKPSKPKEQVIQRVEWQVGDGEVHAKESPLTHVK